MIWDSIICCSQGNCISNNTGLKMQTLETTAKDFFCFEESKYKDLKSVLLYDNTTELVKKENKQKKLKLQ